LLPFEDGYISVGAKTENLLKELLPHFDNSAGAGLFLPFL
jgi:hypothetical protein